jgi:protein-tyrosine kinase
VNDFSTLPDHASHGADAAGAQGTPRAPAPGRPIGAILVERGRLSRDDAERVVRFQHERGMRFGDAAVLLGLLSEEDIGLALSSQFRYAWVPVADDTLDRSLVAAYQPFSTAVEDLRALRSALKLRWLDVSADHKALAIVSPGAHEGRSHIVANLAIVFSQLGERTLVVDADLRRPRQRRLFKVKGQKGLSDILAGRCGFEAVVPVAPLHHLSVLPAGIAPPNPQELLGGDAFPALLATLCRDYDVVIFDTPNATEYADVHTVAKRAGAAVLVTRQHASSLSRAGLLARTLQQCDTTVVGAVLNKG